MNPSETHRPLKTVLAVLVGGCMLLLSACQRGNDRDSADAYMAKGDYASAVIELKSAAQAKPDSVELRVKLADALERQHDQLGMEQQLTRAVDLGGDANLLVPRIALSMLDRGVNDDLILTFSKKTLVDKAADSSLRGTVALAMLARKRLPAAQEQIQSAQDQPSVRLARAQLLVAEGKPKDALQLLNANNDPLAPWWVLRAAKRIAVASGDEENGLVYMRRAQAAAPWNLGVTGEYAEALISAGELEQARVVRDGLRKQAPGFFWTHYLDALLKNSEGRTEETLAAALTALRLSPDHVPAGLLAASTELRKGDVQMADKRLQGLLAKNPELLPALRLLAESQLRLGQLKGASTALQRGLALAPDDPQLLGLKADFEVADGQFKQALTTLTRMTAARPQDPDGMLKLAQLKLRMGDVPGAVQFIDQAATLGNKDPAVMSRIAAMALRMNDTARARKIAEMAVAAQPGSAQANLILAAVQSAMNQRDAAWATTLGVLKQEPANGSALCRASGRAGHPPLSCRRARLPATSHRDQTRQRVSLLTPSDALGRSHHSTRQAAANVMPIYSACPAAQGAASALRTAWKARSLASATQRSLGGALELHVSDSKGQKLM